MSTEARARAGRPEDNELVQDMQSCSEILGIRKTYNGTFQNIEMNVTPHLRLVQYIETVIIDSKPDIIITHHTSDTNNDHLQTSIACQAAFRIFQRRDDIKPIQELWFMEVLSSTEWNVNSSGKAFNPNVFVEVGEERVNRKIEALSMYRGVMRDYPHPRSNEAIKGLAAYRGTQAKCKYAEAFECVFRRMV